MKKNECKFCRHTECYHRIVTDDMSFDELSCSRHVTELHKYADETLRGKLRWNIESTGRQSRGDPVPEWKGDRK
jgi:hypothetical protein